MTQITMQVNGATVSRDVEDRTLLIDFLRKDLQLTGSHVGCDTSQCGACTVNLDGMAVKSCTMLAAQACGAKVVTVEGLATEAGLHPVQEAFIQCHGLQCGFCTPGMIMAVEAFLRTRPASLDDEVIETALEGNICRCTGYVNIIKAVRHAAHALYPDLAAASEGARNDR